MKRIIICVVILLTLTSCSTMCVTTGNQIKFEPSPELMVEPKPLIHLDGTTGK